jgi:hypothetical protein
MTRRRIVLASVLKPVDETRMYEKFALSMGQTNKYDINIIGFHGKKREGAFGIKFYPVFSWNRKSWKRLQVGFKVFGLLLKIRPHLIILHTHELLIPAVVFKILFGTRLIYDVQENYYLNLLYGSGWPFGWKHFLAYWVRLKEWSTRPFIDLYFLAEECYQLQLTFTQSKSMVVKNWANIPDDKITRAPKKEHTLRLLFSGTLAKETGVMEAIRWAEQMHPMASEITLHLAGYCPNTTFLKQLKNVVRTHPWITLQGGEEPLAHAQILKEIQNADIGIISNFVNRSTQGKVPTKVYEYLAHQLPILYQENTPWASIIEQHKGGFTHQEWKEMGRVNLNQFSTFTPKSEELKKSIFWELNSSEWISKIDNLLK